MQLANIELGKLTVSALNMRHGRKAPDIADILPSVRARGVLVPLLVRPADEPERFEIVAGRRRYHAALAVTEEGVEIEPIPCAIMAAGDDAAALEASLIENSARLDPDEVTNWQTFTRLIQKEGRSVEQLAQTFGITDLRVRRILALGNLAPRIRALYGQEAIDVATVRQLTLASKAQQKAWLALYDDPQAHAPTGQRLKGWLFGGESISTKVALFPPENYKGRIVADLFGEDAYFEDADLFWTMQNEAIAAQAEALKDAGWSDVEVLEAGEHFHSWEYEKTPKSKGGKVFIAVRHNGEVTVNEGWLSGKEARRARSEAAKAATSEADREAAKASRPEVTAAQQTYIDLHRHAAARAVLTDHPGAALRLMVAHAITGSALWSIRVEKQNARNDAIAESVETSIAESRFDEKRRAVLALLDFSPEEATVSGGTGDDAGTAAIFARLLALDDADVLRVVAIVMGETMAAGSAVVEAVGGYLKVDMASLWTPDEVFFDLIRDRQVANAMLREVGGKKVADGNVAEKVKTQKAIIRDFLAGANDRRKVDGWVPKWLAFPPASYTARPFETLAEWKAVEPFVEVPPAPEPAPAPIPEPEIAPVDEPLEPYAIAAE